ncbi:DUF5995 family protein [Paractinoplanes durhamensis]|uniref:DUF5995 family protein n=1 Tax=Paractinoplanes durhamensis TaxID=113563 RepID=UPI0034DB0C63
MRSTRTSASSARQTPVRLLAANRTLRCPQIEHEGCRISKVGRPADRNPAAAETHHEPGAGATPFRPATLGLNAHLNHDLPLTLIGTCYELGPSTDGTVAPDYLLLMEIFYEETLTLCRTSPIPRSSAPPSLGRQEPADIRVDKPGSCLGSGATVNDDSGCCAKTWTTSSRPGAP